jgi:hypothetical protein
MGPKNIDGGFKNFVPPISELSAGARLKLIQRRATDHWLHKTRSAFAASSALSISMRHLAPRLMSVELANALTSNACSRLCLRASATAAAAVTWLMKTLLIGHRIPWLRRPNPKGGCYQYIRQFLGQCI